MTIISSHHGDVSVRRRAGQEVAVKVQRPAAQSTISKDLYVMRRGIGVYEALVTRFTAQTTDYQRLLSTFAGAPSPSWTQLLGIGGVFFEYLLTATMCAGKDHRDGAVVPFE